MQPLFRSMAKACCGQGFIPRPLLEDLFPSVSSWDSGSVWWIGLGTVDWDLIAVYGVGSGLLVDRLPIACR